MAIGTPPPLLGDPLSEKEEEDLSFDRVVPFVQPLLRGKPGNIRDAALLQLQEQWTSLDDEQKRRWLERKAGKKKKEEEEEVPETSETGESERGFLRGAWDWLSTPFKEVEERAEAFSKTVGLETGRAQDPGRPFTAEEMVVGSALGPAYAVNTATLNLLPREYRAVARHLAEEIVRDAIPNVTTPIDIPSWLILPAKGAALLGKSGLAAFRSLARNSPRVVRALRGAEVAAGGGMAAAGGADVVEGISEEDFGLIVAGAVQIAGGGMMAYAPKTEKSVLAEADAALKKQEDGVLKETLKTEGKRKSRKFSIGDEGVDSAGNRYIVVDDLGGGQLKVRDVKTGGHHNIRSRALQKGGPKKSVGEAPPKVKVPEAEKIEPVGAPPPKTTEPDLAAVAKEAEAAVSGEALPKAVKKAVDALPPVPDGHVRLWRVEGKTAVKAGGAAGKKGGNWFERNLGAYTTAKTAPDSVRYVDVPEARVEQLKADPNATEVQLPEGYVAQANPISEKPPSVRKAKKKVGEPPPPETAVPTEKPLTKEVGEPPPAEAPAKKDEFDLTPEEEEIAKAAREDRGIGEAPEIRDEWPTFEKGVPAEIVILRRLAKESGESVPVGSLDEIDAISRLYRSGKLKLPPDIKAALLGFQGKLTKNTKRALEKQRVTRDNFNDLWEKSGVEAHEFEAAWKALPEETIDDVVRTAFDDSAAIVRKLKDEAESRGLDPNDPAALREIAREDPELVGRIKEGVPAETATPVVGEAPPAAVEPPSGPPPGGTISKLVEELKQTTSLDELEEMAVNSPELVRYRAEVAEEVSQASKQAMEDEAAAIEGMGFSQDLDGAKLLLRKKALDNEISRRNKLISDYKSQQGMFRFGGRGKGISQKKRTPRERRELAVISDVEGQLKKAAAQLTKHFQGRRSAILELRRSQMEALRKEQRRQMKRGATFEEANIRARKALKVGEADLPVFDKPILSLGPKQQGTLGKWIAREVGPSNPGLAFRLQETAEKLMKGMDVTGTELKQFTDIVIGRDIPGLRGDGTFAAKLKRLAQETHFFTHSFKAAYDLSAPFRQGAIGLARGARFGLTLGKQGGLEWFQAWLAMLKGAKSKQAFEAVQDNVFNRATNKWHDEFGLYRARSHSQDIFAREEELRGIWAEKIPGVAASNRAYIAFLNKLRVDWFDNATKDLIKKGFHPDVPEHKKIFDGLAEYINIATGRGDLRGFEKVTYVDGKARISNQAESVANFLSNFFYSPRYRVSRVQYVGKALTGFKGTQAVGVPGVRGFAEPVASEARKDLAAGAAAVVGVLSLAQASGLAEVTLDIQDPEFMKLKIGNTRVELTAGLAKELHDWLVMATGERVGQEGLVQPAGRARKLSTYIRGRLAPVPAFLDEQFVERRPDPYGIAGSTLGGGVNPITGEYQDVPSGAVELVTPFVIDSVNEAVEANPENTVMENLLIGVFDGVGMSTNSYDEYGFDLKPPALPPEQNRYFDFTPLIGQPPPRE